MDSELKRLVEEAKNDPAAWNARVDSQLQRMDDFFTKHGRMPTLEEVKEFDN